jgi:RNA polymerase sigma factor (sigma-70 family)
VNVATDRDFDVLFRSLYPRLVAVGVGMIGDVEVARDLAQETMARGHRNWIAVSTADSPEAWLRRVMINLVIDHLRRRRVEARALEQVAAAPAVTESAPVKVSMAEMLAVLSERQRAVMTLFYVDDLPIAAIGKVLGIAPGTVKALMWKSRRTLVRHLEEETQ